jgi:hypothetical protein
MDVDAFLRSAEKAGSLDLPGGIKLTKSKDGAAFVKFVKFSNV